MGKKWISIYQSFWDSSNRSGRTGPVYKLNRVGKKRKFTGWKFWKISFVNPVFGYKNQRPSQSRAAMPYRANLFFCAALLTFLQTWLWQGFSIELHSYQEELEYQSLVGLNFNSLIAYYTTVSDFFIRFPLFFNV
jgi:hypothetical protein